MLALAAFELTVREVIADIPHDLGALIAYSLLVAFVAFIVYGSRAKSAEDMINRPAERPPGGDG